MNWVTAEINGQEVSIAFDESSIHIYNAFPIKDDLKSRGYRWNATDKSWFIRPSNIESEILLLKNNLQQPTPSILIKAPEKGELAQFPSSLSVGDLRNRLDQLIREGIRGNVWVRGIVASDVKNYKWASYFDLKDEDEKKDIFFRVEIQQKHLEKINKKLSDSGIAQSLERDLPIFCNVEVHLPLRNVVDIRLNLVDILPEYTQSKIRNQREITLAALTEEGILLNQKKHIVPSYISCIGLITSELGTSVKDIRAGLHPYNDKYNMLFVDSRMEGSYAVENLIQAITFFETNPKLSIDVLIIARGGGSEQSLSVFNDLKLCRKVCLSSIPIITAIGHEKDSSAVEQCSWFTPTPSTPSGIGKYLQNRVFFLQDQFSTTVTGLIHRFTTIHHREMEKIKSFLKNLPSQGSNILKWREKQFFSLARNIEQAIGFTVKHKETRIRDLSISLLKKSKETHVKHSRYLKYLAAELFSRSKNRRDRESGQIEKTILKMDFNKRLRRNQEQNELIRKKTQVLFSHSNRKITYTRNELQSRIRFIQASDPVNILKKGFSLVLDEQNRVIKSLDEFEKKENAILKFHDGITGIQKTKPDIQKEES